MGRIPLWKYNPDMQARIGPKKPFRHFIREWMEEKDLTQERLADRMEIGQGTLSKLLSGKMRLNDERMAQFAHALDLKDIADIFRDPRRPTQEELLAGLSDEQVAQVVQIVDVIRKTGTRG